MRHQLYRIRDTHGRLLYIGISFDLARRLGQHADRKPWWPDVATIELEHHENRASVVAAERAAIANEAPLYNVQHNAGRAERPLTPEQRRTVERALATPGFVGQVLPDEAPPIGHSGTESDRSSVTGTVTQRWGSDR